LEKRARWDEVFGHVAALFKQSRAWEPLGFASFRHYCEEGLGMAERTVAQRIALERSLYRIPVLRRALREKRISYEKARIIARHAEGEEVRDWVERAETMTCVALRRAMQDKDEAQMCARGTFGVWMTVSVAEVAGRKRRPGKPHQSLCGPPPARHPRRPDASHRHGAGQARLGVRPAAQLRGRRV